MAEQFKYLETARKSWATSTSESEVADGSSADCNGSPSELPDLSESMLPDLGGVSSTVEDIKPVFLSDGNSLTSSMLPDLNGGTSVIPMFNGFSTDTMQNGLSYDHDSDLLTDIPDSILTSDVDAFIAQQNSFGNPVGRWHH